MKFGLRSRGWNVHPQPVMKKASATKKAPNAPQNMRVNMIVAGSLFQLFKPSLVAPADCYVAAASSECANKPPDGYSAVLIRNDGPNSGARSDLVLP